MVFRPPPFKAPYDPLFDDAWLKWGWAVYRGVALKAELEGALNLQLGQTFDTIAEYHPEFHGFCIKINRIDPYPDRWGLLYGEVLHSYRSALDNAAWAIVQRGRRPPETLSKRQRRLVAFPCYTERPVAKGNTTARQVNDARFEKCIPGARRADLTAVRWAQPYTYLPKRSDAQESILAFITEKNNLDKHKTIQPVQPAMHDYFLTGQIVPRDCIVRRFVPLLTPPIPVPFDLDTELARVYVRKTGPNPDIQVPGTIATTFVFNRYLPVGGFFEHTADWIAQLLRCFSEAPPDLGKRLGLET